LAPTVEIAATGFCYPGGILQPFHRQDQQILRLPTAAAARSHQAIHINNRRVHRHIIRLSAEALSSLRTTRSKSMKSIVDEINLYLNRPYSHSKSVQIPMSIVTNREDLG
jgi:hypothetical protein